MDSMRSLNTSLPRPTRKRRSVPAQPPEQLIQAFKSAALSVTNLYKTAATDQRIARESGYQEALDDLLAFLDRENIGLDDGEGWRIRQWATERLNGSPPAAAASESEEERGDVPQAAGNKSPVVERVIEVEQPRQTSRSASPTMTAATPTNAPTSALSVISTQPSAAEFTFQSVHPYPQDMEIQVSDTNDTNRSSPSPQPQAVPSSAVRLEVVPRGSRTPHRNSRHNQRSTQSTRLQASITGSKRRLPFSDYFDIGSLGDGKDYQGGGGKRGRFI